MNSPGLFQISAVLFLSGSAGNILKSAASFFFHPDCTVGSGFQPDQPPMAGRGLICLPFRKNSFTAGRELHPTLKNVTFYVINYECGHLPRLSDYLYYHNRKFGAVNTLTFSEESPPAVLPEWKPQLLPPKQPALRLPPPAEAHPAHFSLPEQPPQNSP